MSGSELIDVKTELQLLGLQGEDLEQSERRILELRQELVDSRPANAEESWSGVAIANNPKAILVVETITDMIIEKQGILERAMKGEDIHDSLANIKAKVESLVIGGKVKAHTLDHITQVLKVIKRTGN